MNTLVSFLLAARPKTLPAGIVPVWAGCMIVWKMRGFWDLHLAVLTLASALCIQIACNFFNDAIDFRKSADTAKRQGPTRMTASGQLSARTVQMAGALFLLGACVAAWPLIGLRGWPMLAIGIPSLFFAYGYTGGPWPLAYKGLAEVFVILFFGLVAVMGTVFVQVGWTSGDAMLYAAAGMVGVQCGLLSAVMVCVNNIRDRAEDESTGKRTLAVRLGDAKARRLACSFIVATYVTLPHVSKALGGIQLSWYWLPLILLAGVLMLKILRTPADKRMNGVLALAALHLVAFVATLACS